MVSAEPQPSVWSELLTSSKLERFKFHLLFVFPPTPCQECLHAGNRHWFYSRGARQTQPAFPVGCLRVQPEQTGVQMPPLCVMEMVIISEIARWPVTWSTQPLYRISKNIIWGHNFLRTPKMLTFWYTRPLLITTPMTDIVNGLQFSFPLIVAINSSQSSSLNSKKKQMNKQTKYSGCMGWDNDLCIPCLFGMPIHSASTFWRHEDKAMTTPAWLHPGICVGQNQDNFLPLEGIGSSYCPGCPGSSQQSPPSNQTKLSREAWFITAPGFGC